METTSKPTKAFGKFNKIMHFGQIFEILEDFLGDAKTMFILSNINSSFQMIASYKFQKLRKLCKYINSSSNKYMLFSPYSWLHTPELFESKKDEFIKYIKKNEDIDINQNDFKGLYNMSKRFYEKLDFEGFKLAKKGCNIIFQYFKNYTNVKILILSHCDITTQIFEESISLLIKKLYNLEELKLDNNKLDNDCGKLLNSSLEKKSLNEISLKWNAIAEGITSFINKSIQIKCIELSNCKLNGHLFEYISSQLVHNKYVSLLDFSLNNIGKDIKPIENFFKNLTLNKAITHLYLSNCSITSDACEYIGKYIKNNNVLFLLSLQKNFLDDQGCAMIIEALYKNKSLVNLNLSMINTTYKTYDMFIGNYKKINVLKFDFCYNDIDFNEKIFENEIVKSGKKWIFGLGNMWLSYDKSEEFKDMYVKLKAYKK